MDQPGLAALAVLLVAGLALAPHADACIYWTTRSGNIGRADLDGTGLRRRLLVRTGGVPADVAVAPGTG